MRKQQQSITDRQFSSNLKQLVLQGQSSTTANIALAQLPLNRCVWGFVLRFNHYLGLTIYRSAIGN